MALRIYHDDRCLLHENGPGHPERPERLRSVLRTITETRYRGGVTIESPEPVSRELLERVHAPAYVRQVERSSHQDRTVFDADTSANRHSYEAARLAAGGAVDAVRAAISDGDSRPFVAMRPPGHHALADSAMGFCLFNNAAVGAVAALDAGLERVAIVDWDVHHGNGTEAIFYDRSDVLYVSVHQAPHYPGTGRGDDTGAGAGEGYTVNIPLPAGCGRFEYLGAFDTIVVPVLSQYAPELVIVSAGFDGHHRDPLAGMLLDGAAYHAFTKRLLEVAAESAAGRIVHLLEGGYDLQGLTEGVDGVLRALTGDETPATDASVPPAAGEAAFGGRAGDLAAESLRSTASALGNVWTLDVE